MKQFVRKFLASLTLGVIVLLPFANTAQAFDVTLSGVKDGGHYNANVTPQFSASSGASVSATLNGGNFSSNTIVSNEGRYWLSVRASLNGQTTYRFAEFYIDKQAPTITINGVYDGELTNQNITPTFTTNEGNISATLNGTGFSSGTTVSSEGTKWLSVVARDEAGNVTYGFREFTIDKTAPVITINGVANGGNYSSSRTITYSTNEGSATATLNGSGFSSGGSAYSDGSYSLTVTASDAAGNVSTKTVNFTIDKGSNNGDDGEDGEDGQDGQDGTDGQDGQSGADGVISYITGATSYVTRYFGGGTAQAEETTEPEVIDEANYLSDISIKSVENADGLGGDLTSCRNLKVIGKAKEGLLIILYFKRTGDDTPIIGFVRADATNRFTFISDEPFEAGEYTIYAKAAEEGGKTGPMLELKTFEVEKCNWWTAWIWVIILLILLILGFLIGWYLRRKKEREYEELDELNELDDFKGFEGDELEEMNQENSEPQSRL